ncbi:MAG: acetyl-CoA carboxylase biotin carboxyl carrier protein [Verrucomicrobia bacterium]|nr:acetyl-CoA carboxylase biotin carboxyl carrier protein [Verrucomicrobiota bacterium]
MPAFGRFCQFSARGEKSGIARSRGFLLNGPPQKHTNASSPLNTQPRLPLDLKQIKQIIELMKRSELTEFAVEEEGFKLKIRRGTNGLPVVSTVRGSNPPFVQVDTVPPMPLPVAAAAAPAPAPAAAAAEEAGVSYIKSPMVGTFYRAASPESKPFTDVGAKIVENSVVCIIEAMKIMNEIQAETKGTVLEVLVDNGQPVEYGQRLFKIKQSS